MMVGGELAEVCGQFCGMGQPVDARDHVTGHIHDSWLVTCDAGTRPALFLLQRMNTRVFPDPDAVMSNISLVTSHIRSGAGRERPVLTPVATTMGSPSYIWRDRRGAFWRSFEHLDGCYSREVVATPEQASEVGRAYGQFQQMLTDLEPDRLLVTIAAFHDLGRWMRDLDAAIRADAAGRASEVVSEIEMVLDRRATVRLAEGLVASSETRIAHNDAKVSNVMFDASGRAACVVDLDTVMAGPVLWDFGDMVRSTACPAAEDETDLERVRVDTHLFEGLCSGYLEEAGAFLTRAECDGLVDAAIVIVLEQTARFLIDHLNGDSYFRVSRPQHNLIRCRAQLCLLEALELRRDEMIKTVRATIPPGAVAVNG